MLQLLLKLFTIAGDIGFDVLEKRGPEAIASIKTFLKSLGPAGEFVLAVLEEDPRIAIPAFIAGSVVAFFFGSCACRGYW